jgi:hypothetical protein
MAAGTYDLQIEAGATCRRVLTWLTGSPPVAVDLTGYTAHAQLRDTSRTAVVDLTVGSGLTLGGSAGTITLLITATQTAALQQASQPLLEPRRVGSWDLKLTAPDGTVIRLLEGAILVSAEVTV